MDSSPFRHHQFARALLLTVMCACPALMCLYSPCITDPDIWWHLRTGEWILHHGGVPHTDPFSSLGRGMPWEAYSWLFDLLVLKLFQRWDLVGLLSYTTGMVLAITLAIYRLVKRLQPEFNLTALLTLVAMFGISPLFTPRPWLFTVLFFALEMGVLMQVRKTGKVRELLWLPLIFALWANLHIQFVDGLVVLGAAVLEPFAARWWPGQQTRVGTAKLWGVFAACVLATLVNPYGWRIYKSAYALSSQTGVLNTVNELLAMPFRDVSNYIVLFLALSALAALAWNRRIPFFEASSLTLAAFLSFRSRRDVWLLAVVAIGVLASSLRGDEEDPRRRLPVLAVPFVAVAVALLVFLGSVLLNANNPSLHLLLAKELPVGAAQFVNERNFSGPLYNTYDWGGFLIWNLPSLPVSIDGRAALHGDARIDRSSATWNGAPDWASDAELSSARLVIAPVKMPLTQLLRMDSRFQLEFEDKVAAVFIARRTGAGVTAPSH